MVSCHEPPLHRIELDCWLLFQSPLAGTEDFIRFPQHERAENGPVFPPTPPSACRGWASWAPFAKREDPAELAEFPYFHYEVKKEYYILRWCYRRARLLLAPSLNNCTKATQAGAVT